MNLRRASLLLFAASSLLAQAPDAWETLLSRLRLRPNRQGAYQFLSRGWEFDGTWRQELALTRLRAAGE
ncbi:MAG: hypothetical protein KGN80_05225, partial [Acidobacteriota bacterium]|nr:hypothetical protein [Acidobacteriota bacterium]